MPTRPAMFPMEISRFPEIISRAMHMDRIPNTEICCMILKIFLAERNRGLITPAIMETPMMI
jgi:hypothetical protein